MAKAKKLLLTLLSLAFSIVMVCSVVACGGGEDNDGDSTGSGVTYTVTQDQFNTAANSATYTNFKAKIYNVSKDHGVVIPDETGDVIYVATENAIMMSMAGATFYYEKTADGYYGYTDDGGVWQKVAITENIYNELLSRIEMVKPSKSIEMYGLVYSALTFNSTEKCYTYAPPAEPGSTISATLKLYFENGKIVKFAMDATNAELQQEISQVMEYSYNQTITLPSVGGDDNEGEHVCDMQATAWFDANHNYPKTLECTCGETITRTDIEIATAEEFVTLANDLANGVDVGKEKIKLVADIDLTGVLCPSLVINNMRKETKIYADSEVTISGFDKALISQVKTGLVLENITLDGFAVYNNDGIAAGFIDVVNIGATAMKKDVTIKNCKVINSTINASTTAGDNNCFAGAIYGKVADGSALDTLRVDRCTVENTTVTSSVYAGAVAGAMSNVASGKNPTVAIAESVIQSVTVVSAKERGAGIVIGLSGFGACNIDQDTSDVALTSNNSATGNDIANLALYGVTGWASASDKGTLTMMAAMQLQYGDMTAVHQLPNA